MASDPLRFGHLVRLGPFARVLSSWTVKCLKTTKDNALFKVTDHPRDAEEPTEPYAAIPVDRSADWLAGTLAAYS